MSTKTTTTKKGKATSQAAPAGAPLSYGERNPSTDEPRQPGAGQFLAGSGSPSRRMAAFNRWRERYNPLRGLNVQRAITMLEQWQRGEFADPCWAYLFVENTDADLFALCERRESALLELNWHISPMTTKWRKDDARLAAFDKKLGDEQIACLGEAYDRMDNLYEAIGHMGTTTFRGFSHLEKYRDEAGTIYHLEPVDQWNMVRDLLRGPWKYNPDAITTRYEALPSDLEINPDDWVIREQRRHVDRLGLIKFIRANLSEKDWDAFIEIYGIPSGVVMGPPNVPQGQEEEYKAAAKDIAEGGSGYLPNGSQYVPNQGPRGVNPFRPRLDFLTEKLILAGTGGLLTMLVQSGSGTLAGNAHQETFEKIARTEARKISEIFNRAIDSEILAKNFPGQPVVAYFELAANDELDPDKIVDHALKLSQAGFKMDVAQLSEKTGYTLTEKPIEREDLRVQAEEPGPVKNRAKSGDDERQPDPKALGKLLARSRILFGEALSADLRPLREALSNVLAGDDAGFAGRAQALYDALPGLGEKIIGANGSADALEKILGAAAAAGLQPGGIKNRAKASGGIRNMNPHHNAKGQFASADEQKAIAAFKQVSESHHDVPAALNLPETGPVDFRYGDKGEGVAHIIQRAEDRLQRFPACAPSVDTVMEKVPQTLVRGKFRPLNDRVGMKEWTDKDGTQWRALLAKDYHGQPSNAWLLSGYDVDESKTGYRGGNKK